ncbi:MAG: hypothetical protein IPP58_12185 [Holophagaceae bacterium]|uniref:Uncharacterized protein n=1 Tax=Candidatus Geothrix skivensis TaxID=2954439 RepID=A0A9D7SGT8_9BACT|nr:hypothetical protein [Candidatus Geothrix skivensis]
MDHLQATHPGLRLELRGYLVRYRHLQPLVVAAVALGELEMALELLQQVSIHLPADGDEAQRLQAFLSPRIAAKDVPP